MVRPYIASLEHFPDIFDFLYAFIIIVIEWRGLTISSLPLTCFDGCGPLVSSRDFDYAISRSLSEKSADQPKNSL